MSIKSKVCLNQEQINNVMGMDFPKKEFPYVFKIVSESGNGHDYMMDLTTFSKITGIAKGTARYAKDTFDIKTAMTTNHSNQPLTLVSRNDMVGHFAADNKERQQQQDELQVRVNNMNDLRKAGFEVIDDKKSKKSKQSEELFQEWEWDSYKQDLKSPKRKKK